MPVFVVIVIALVSERNVGMSVINPSHLLISRNPPRSLAHPQLAPASTSRHAQCFPLGPWTQSTDETAVVRQNGHLDALVKDNSADEDVDIHLTFRPDAALPGKVKVVVGRHEFWCHKEVLWFASPFSQSLLQGT